MWHGLIGLSCKKGNLAEKLLILPMDSWFIAQKLKAQRHHVSQAINEQAGKSFAEFVNAYRVKAAQELLATTSKQELNAIEVAYQVGFGTKNAFNLAFKKITGTTPTSYRQMQEKKV